jgi:outer membrane biosynthesis protein TonB
MAKFEFIEVSDAADTVREYLTLNRDKVPEHLRDRMRALIRQPSPVELVTGFVRAVYANREDATPQAMKIAAAAADLIDIKGFHDRLEGNAGKVALALARDAGVPLPNGKTYPPESKDPEPAPEFVKPPEAPPAPPQPMPTPSPDVDTPTPVGPEPAPAEPTNEVVVDAEQPASRKRAAAKK